MSKKKGSFTLITLIIGFMLAIQYQTIKHPKTKDTRDEWQLKESLKKEQETQLQLLQQMQKYDQQLAGYETKLSGGKEEALNNTLQQLREQAGLTDMTGKGLTLQLGPLFTDNTPGQAVPVLSPQLLQRLINELNTYGAIAVQVADQRIVATTAIRDVNGRTSVNDVPLPPLPLEIKVITKDAQKLYDRMKVSNSFDHFAIDNIALTMSKPMEDIRITKYDRPIKTSHMKAVKVESGGK
ncbi:DUF881 domain-containing protein [Microbacteriaceae bacterium 4G12]